MSKKVNMVLFTFSVACSEGSTKAALSSSHDFHQSRLPLENCSSYSVLFLNPV